MPEFDDWIEQQDRNKLQLWREAMAQLRQLHTDIWNGVRFFLTVSGILIAAIAALWNFEFEVLRLIAMLVLVWAGITITVVAIFILDKHRNRYVHMLLRKTLIEYELGFFDQEIAEMIEVAFPWSVPAEYVEDVRANPQRWLREQPYRAGTVTFLLLVIYSLILIFYMFLVVFIGSIIFRLTL